MVAHVCCKRLSQCFPTRMAFFRHVSSLCFKCFSSFRCTFQLLRADVAKVDQDIAYVAMVAHVCCKRLSLMFHLFLYMYVASVSDACLKCFICLLWYVASVAFECFKNRSRCCTCWNDVLTICLKCFIYFRRILQRFHPDVVKVNLMFESCSGTHLPHSLACSC
jgi:hypothetical protein